MPDTGTAPLPGLQSDYAVEVVDLVTHWGDRKILNKVNQEISSCLGVVRCDVGDRSVICHVDS